jgi:membrane protease subunit (stomatin/prohibitin family)
MEERIAKAVHIIDGIRVDARLQKQLSANIERVCRIQKREFSLKYEDRIKFHQEISKCEDELNAKQIHFDKQREAIENMKQALTNEVAKETLLRRKSHNFKIFKLSEM